MPKFSDSISKRYTSRELMEIAVKEMRKSIPEHDDKTDPKVGAVMATESGELIDLAHRGELRQGDHAEYTILERKHRNVKLDGNVIYATLEPCAPGARSKTKLGCAERIVNARIKKVYIGIEDPDPSVKGNGIAYLKNKGVEIEFFDQDLQEIILEENKQFLIEAELRAKQAEDAELIPVYTPLDEALENYDFPDFSEEALRLFKERIGILYDINSNEFKSVFKKWNFLKINSVGKVHPTGMGILLFGKNPQITYPQSLVKFTIKTKNEDIRILDFDGPLILIPEKIEVFLNINFPRVIDRSSFARKEIQEVYFEVLREVIINAIVHRDYSIEGANVNVKIDDEKIEIDSPGKPLVSLQQLKDFTAPTFSTNPKIANVFYQMKFIEKRNLGMNELHQYSSSLQVNKPTIEYEPPYLKVTIWRMTDGKVIIPSEISDKQKVKPTVSGNEMPSFGEVIEFVGKKERISSGDFALEFNMSVKTASRQLNKLVGYGILKREGEKRGTRYFLPKEDESFRYASPA